MRRYGGQNNAEQPLEPDSPVVTKLAFRLRLASFAPICGSLVKRTLGGRLWRIKK